MIARLRVWTLAAILCGVPAVAWAVSAVFNGDPVDPATGLPYVILPGLPLVLPGPDGVLGTADDVVNTAIIGDIDMVVRSGSPPATAVIPPPTAHGGPAAVPIGVAGSSAGGGTPIPFTVFLSDGVTSADAPYGHLLAAADMDGLPVIVAAFADLDGDGFIGPTNQDDAGAADNHLEVRELEPVGRGVALFSGGVARGSVTVHTGRPARLGGMTVVLTAMALTGPFDPNVFGGAIPSGPAISTALPFLPQTDLSRLIRDRPVAVGPGTTLQEVVQFAALPVPGAAAPFALPTDGSGPTIDVARVQSQPAVGVDFREPLADGTAQSVGELVLGTKARANRRRLRVVPVDRWGNPTDVAPMSTVTLHADPPLVFVDPARGAVIADLPLATADGAEISLKIPYGTPSGVTGTLTAERDGLVIGALSYHVDARVNQPRADMVVPSPRAPTIQAAVDAVFDRNRDGVAVIAVRPGIYRETVTVNRSVVLHGAGAGLTLLQGDGTADVLAVGAPQVTIQGLTVVGGAGGVALGGSNDLLTDVRAWHNSGAGITAAGPGVQVWRATALHNGAEGVRVTGGGVVCADSDLLDNGGAGATVSVAPASLLDGNRVADNGNGGLTLTAASGTTVSGNACVANLSGPASGPAGGAPAGSGSTASGGGGDTGGESGGAGIGLFSASGNSIAGNLTAVNDGDGLDVDTTSGNVISGNVIDSNHGYGLFVRRSSNDDFGAAGGVQSPPGDNVSTGNRKGDVFVRTN